MNVECHLCSYTERIVEKHLGSLRLLFHKRFLAALPEQGSAARDALVQMDVFPPARAATSAALLSRSWRCQGADQRLPAAGSGCFKLRCWVRGIVNSRAVDMSGCTTRCSEREVAVLRHLVRTFLKMSMQ